MVDLEKEEKNAAIGNVVMTDLELRDLSFSQRNVDSEVEG